MLPRVEPPPNLPPEVLLLGSAEFLSDEAFNKELVAEERLNGIIDRAMKRLIQAKGIKELLYRAPAVENARKSTSTVRKIAKGK